MHDIEQLKKELADAIQENYKASAVTKDGVKIEIGQTYFIDHYYKCTEIFIEANVIFGEESLTIKAQHRFPAFRYTYNDLFSTKEAFLRDKIEETKKVLSYHCNKVSEFHKQLEKEQILLVTGGL